MNVPRQYKPELFDILEIPPSLYSKRQICIYIEEFIQRIGCDCADTLTGEVITFKKSISPRSNAINRYYNLENPLMRRLTGITNRDRYIIFEGNKVINETEPFYTAIYKRWKL